MMHSLDKTTGARILSVGPVHFDGNLIDEMRAAQRAARAIERKTMTAARRTQRSGRAVKYAPESDSALVGWLLSMTPTDA